MLKLKKFFICFVLAILLISSSVLATDNTVMPINEETPTTIEESTTTNTAKSLYEDIYIYDTDSYTLNDIVYGNIFASTTKFVTNPRNNGGVISGNLFVVSDEVIIGSDVSYSDNKDKYDNYIISSINSKSVINGNVYVFSESFTLEAGSVIYGDLYVASTNIDIHPDSVVNGNIFITGTNINLKGQIGGSAYITAEKFDMNYFGYISRDLYLNSTDATISGVIYRNAFITVSNKLETTPYFRVDQNLSVDFANDFVFSGEVKQNAKINAKNLSFNIAENGKCIINGNLDCATKNEITVPDEIVVGEVTHSEYVEMDNNKLSIQNGMLTFFGLLVYVFVIVLLSRLIAPNAIKNLSILDLKNIAISFVIGFVSLIAIVLLLILLLTSGVGLALALLFVIGYLFVLGLALPLLLHDIVKTTKWKMNLFVKILIVTAIFYIISLIPVIGSPFVFATLLIGTGRILLGLFKKK